MWFHRAYFAGVKWQCPRQFLHFDAAFPRASAWHSALFMPVPVYGPEQTPFSRNSWQVRPAEVWTSRCWQEQVPVLAFVLEADAVGR